MKKDEAPRSRLVTAANDNDNDNDIAPDPVAVDAALTRIAKAIGRHIAREHIRARKAANDNGADAESPRSPRR